jgi:exodeoxyribonuclease VII small subunit
MTDVVPETLTFEQALAELERIVRELEDGKTGLEEALTRYEQGVSLLKRCYTQLRQSEQRILELTGCDADGNPLTRPFEHAATVNATVKEKDGAEVRGLFD